MKAALVVTILAAMASNASAVLSRSHSLRIADETIPTEGDIPLKQFTLTYLAYVVLQATLIKTAINVFRLNISALMVLMLDGIFHGLLGKYVYFIGEYLQVVYHTDPKAYAMYAFPVLIFKIAFTLDIYTFNRAWLQVVLISTVGELISAIFIGVMAMAVVSVHHEWSFAMAFMTGIMCSPIDTGDIVKRLKEIEKTKHLIVLLEGENMIGCAILNFFATTLLLFDTKKIAGWSDGIWKVLLIVVSGPTNGYIIGRLWCLIFTKISGDRVCLMACSLSFPMVLYYTCRQSEYISAVLCIIVVGLLMNKERNSLPKELNAYLVNNWELIAFLMDSFVFFTFGVMAFDLYDTQGHYSDFTTAMVSFVVTTFGRFLSFIVLAPVLSRISYGMSFRCLLIAVWAGVKGSLTLCFTLFIFSSKDFSALNQGMVKHMIGLVMFTQIVNVGTMNWIMKLLGLYDLSVSRKTNMNACIKRLLIKRSQIVGMLKMERFLVEANWDTVLAHTNIKHPYQLKLKDSDDEDEFTMGYRFTICPDCKLEIAGEPSAKEFTEMTKEARLRILKAKKISYTRQYESGMISKNSHRILIQAIELAMDSDEALIEVDHLLETFERKGTLYKIRSTLAKLLKLTIKSIEVRPPGTYWRRKSYHIITSKWFEPIILAAILLNIIPMAVELHYQPLILDPLGITLCLMNMFFFLIYLAEFGLKILGYSYKSICRDGFRTYFSSGWNIFDFSVLLAALADLLMDGVEYLYSKKFSNNKKVIPSAITIPLQCLRIFRMFRLLKVFSAYYPSIIRHMDNSLDLILAEAYDMGKGFVTGEDEILDMLNQMVDNIDIREDMRSRMETDKQSLITQLGIVQKYRPWIAITVKTRQAITTVLNSMSEIIYELKVSGWVDDVEFMKLDECLQTQFKFVKKISKVHPSPPQVIFKEVLWMANDEKIIDFLYDNVLTKTFDPGEVICSVGTLSDGIYILVTGLLKLKYTPQTIVLERLKENGELPIIDYIGSWKFDDRFMDYIVSGNSIGELCFLTGRTYNCSITADTTSQAYLLTHDVMRQAIKMSDHPTQGLVSRLWKFISMRLGTALLMTVPAYQTYQQEKIRYMLEQSFVPNLSRFKTLVMNDMMEDVILIEGIVVDTNTGKVYVAPCNIPRTVKKLTLIREIEGKSDTFEPKLLIVPVQDSTDHAVMQIGEEQSDMVSVTSSKCHHHVIQKKIRRRKKRGRTGAKEDHSSKSSKSSKSTDKRTNVSSASSGATSTRRTES